MAIDFSHYSYNDLIPAKTIEVVHMHVRPGDGTDGVLKRSKDGTCEMLDLEFTVLGGLHAKRKFFTNMVVIGSTDGQKKAVDRSFATLKGIIDSAKYLDPNDKTEATCNARKLEWRDFDGLRFLAEIGVEPGKDGYPDKNILVRAITKDRPEWGGRAPIDQGPSGGPAPSSGAAGGGSQSGPASGSPPTSTPIKKPEWA